MQTSIYNRSRLSERIRRFSISFRLRPIQGSVGEVRSESGCEVELIGQHYSMGRHVIGGCPHCIKVLLALLDLHDCALSARQCNEYLGSQCEKVIHYASTSADWPEVVLDVKVVRRATPQRVYDDWAVKLTGEIRSDLLDLGCRELPSSVVPMATMPDWQDGLAGRAV
ncbi:MAG TPA: hypothetical protein VE866_16605 [Candidatus Binatia bacterium]|nr:hypothetical protein [Candidatus Binatia bacterium]